jgi:hypothetical protein
MFPTISFVAGIVGFGLGEGHPAPNEALEERHPNPLTGAEEEGSEDEDEEAGDSEHK